MMKKKVSIIVTAIITSLFIIACAGPQEPFRPYVNFISANVLYVEHKKDGVYSKYTVDDRNDIEQIASWYDSLDIEVDNNIEFYSSPGIVEGSEGFYIYDESGGQLCIYCDYGEDMVYLLIQGEWYKVNYPMDPLELFSQTE